MPLANEAGALPASNDVPKFPLKVAFLGPPGTYSHQAAYNQFGDNVEYIEKDTIASAFSSIPSEATTAVIPAENSIFGSVVETLDLLRLPEVGNEKFVTGQVVLEVQHCLLSVKGTKLYDIKNVLSHEQALGQCSNFLKANLPDAVLTKTSSTSAAAGAILKSGVRETSAAICSEVCAKVYPDLVMLEKGIQNENNNFTKFWVIRGSESRMSLAKGLTSAGKGSALLRMSPQLDGAAELSSLFAQLKIPVQSIDRRPSTNGIPFHDVYFVRVEQASCTQDISWTEAVHLALECVRTLKWEACILGIWYA